MNNAEKRIKNFSSGLRKLNKKNQDYINKLAHVLLLVEQPPVCPSVERADTGKEKVKTTCMGFEEMKDN
ncbi:MAG: hypothetical protein LBH16_06895 [Treponema sp.]|jgi:hypothetical protein|nr:hypothetical protein [Treponema sp.]